MLAAISLLAPSRVILGYFLFIIPGLILTLAPTVIVYLAATMVIRAMLPLSVGPRRNVAGFAIALMIGCAAVQPFRSLELDKYHSVLLPDVVADKPIVLGGHVRIEINDRYVGRNALPQLNHVSAALLSLSQAKIVTFSRKDQVAAFALVPASEHPEPGLFPKEPGQILQTSSAVQNF